MPSSRTAVPLPPLPESAAESSARVAPADIAAEHHELRLRLTRLRDTTDLPVLIVELAALRDLLARHFAAEEAEDGLHADVERTAPHLLAQLERILADHAALLAETEAARAAAIDCWRGPAANVLFAVERLSERLSAHEHEEEALFADSIYLDLGAGQ